MRRAVKILTMWAVALLALSFVGSSSSYAQDTQSYLPKKIKRDNTPPRLIGPQDGQGVDDTTTIVSSLRGLVIVGSPGRIRAGGTSGDGVEVRDDSLLVPDRVIRAADQFIGQPVSLQSLHELTKAMVVAYRRSDLPIVNVVTPEQDVSNGVVQILVVIGRLGEKYVEGNRFFPAELYLSGVSVNSGEIIRGGELLDDLRWLNRNPFRRVDAVYTPGRGYGTTDVILRPYELRPFTVYGGIENTGNDTLGEERLFFGGIVGNALGLDESIGYQLTTVPEFDDLFAHVLTFTMPVGHRGEIQLLGAHVTSETNDNLINQEGESTQLAAYYHKGLRRIFPEVAHDVRVGFEFKQSDNNLEFGGLTVTDTKTEVAQFVLGYSAEKWWSWGHTRVNADLFLSPGGLTGNNEDRFFRQIRANASADYVYAKFGLEHRKDLPGDFRLESKIVAQVSDTNLLASEQLLFGGVSSIRGFENNLGRADEGIVTRLTIFTPGISVFGARPTPAPAGISGGSKDGGYEEPRSFRDELRFFGFYDHGWGSDVNKLVGQEDIELSSAGIGLRYDFSRYMSAEVAYGWQLEEDGVADDEDGFLHFRVTTRY